MKELLSILSGNGWTLKQALAALLACVAFILLICESDSLAWLCCTKVAGIALLYFLYRISVRFDS